MESQLVRVGRVRVRVRNRVRVIVTDHHDLFDIQATRGDVGGNEDGRPVKKQGGVRWSARPT